MTQKNEMPPLIFAGFLGSGKIWGEWTKETHSENTKYIRADIAEQMAEALDSMPDGCDIHDATDWLIEHGGVIRKALQTATDTGIKKTEKSSVCVYCDIDAKRDADYLLKIISEIRESLGVGGKPMLSELPGIVRQLKKERDDLTEAARRVVDRWDTPMKDSETLLKMIEEVDPADTATLDEIDARFFCFLEKYTLDTFDPIEYGEFTVKEREGHFDLDPDGGFIQYTRSRDALKAVRPEGWKFTIGGFYKGNKYIYAVSAFKGSDTGDYRDLGSDLSISGLPTEELAELHSIIQAIQYERTAHDGQ